MVILNSRIWASPQMGRWLAMHGYRTKRIERQGDQMIRLSLLTTREAHEVWHGGAAVS